MGRRLRHAALWLATGLAFAGGGPARADWQVHRDGTRDLLARAAQALDAAPDDDALARRVVRLAGRLGAAALRARFAARAAGAKGYAPVAANAQILLALGDASSAAAAFAEASRLAPGSAAAAFGRARALAAAGDGAEARAAFDEAFACALAHGRPNVQRRVLETELAALPSDARGADLERVIALRQKLVAIAPDDRQTERLADALEQSGRLACAAQALEARLSPDRPLAKLGLALRAIHLRLGARDPADADRAAATADSLVGAVAQASPSARRDIWAGAREVARARGTLAALADTLARAPGPVEWDLLGQIRSELGDLNGALDATRTAHARDPGNVEIGQRLIAALDRAGREREALDVYVELERRAGTDVGLAIGLARRQRESGEHAASEATFDQALARFGRQPDALEALAELAATWNDDRRARATWTRLVRRDPTSEIAIVGLGEAEFQAGRPAEAQRTWAALVHRAPTPAAGHLRLGEILLDHELLEDAREEARRAETADPKGGAAHRLLAQIDERQHKPSDAVDEWRRVLTATGNAPTGEDARLRREARTRLLGLLGRLGRGRLDAEVRRLQGQAAAHPDDTEALLFLAEAEQQLGDTAGAAAALKKILDRGGADGASPAARQSAVDAGFALVRLLKHNGQVDEAAARLAELTRLAPGRAREAELQSAELALDRYDIPAALGHADAASAGADPPALVRIAELREHAGDEDGATADYRRALAGDAPPTAALALGRLLTKRSDPAGASAVLETLLREGRDDASVSDAVRRALSLDEYLGRLPELAELLQPAAGPRTPAHTRALIEVLARVLPAIYRDPAADAARVRLVGPALGPLLDVVTAAEMPDRDAIGLLGMLGGSDAIPALERIAARGSAAATPDPHDVPAGPRLELRSAAVLALGRLGGSRAAATLQELAAGGPAALRPLAIWALGRTRDPRAFTTLARAADDPRPDVAALACLGLGRQPNGAGMPLLARVAADATRATLVRQGAALGLGAAGRATGIPPLLVLLEGGDAELARAAALALGWSRQPAARTALLARTLLPATLADDAELPRAALACALVDGAPPDEARRLDGSDLSARAVLAPLLEAPTNGDLAPLWRSPADRLAMEAQLADALATAGPARRRALAALDGRIDGPGLGGLLPDEAPVAADALITAREVAAAVADRVAVALDDPARDVRALALRVLAKIDDARINAARLAEAVAEGSPLMAEAAATGAALITAAHPAEAPAIAAAVAPLLIDDGAPDSWTRRLAAVQVLAAVGAAGRPALARAAASDRNAIVRGEALAALGERRAAFPSGG